MALRAPLGIFSLLICFSSLADETNTPRKGIALVLSGGGVRSSAHVGVLKVIEEKRIPVDFIAGTSMGAIIGGLYSSGLSPEETNAFWVRRTGAICSAIDRRGNI